MVLELDLETGGGVVVKKEKSRRLRDGRQPGNRDRVVQGTFGPETVRGAGVLPENILQVFQRDDGCLAVPGDVDATSFGAVQSPQGPCQPVTHQSRF